MFWLMVSQSSVRVHSVPCAWAGEQCQQNSVVEESYAFSGGPETHGVMGSRKDNIST